MREELREQLAAHAHKTWQNWMNYMEIHLDSEHIRRWERQADTAYEDLPEAEKASDRAIADAILALPDLARILALLEQAEQQESYKIVVIDEGAIAPTNPYNFEDEYREYTAFSRAWQLFTANYAKVVSTRCHSCCPLCGKPSPNGEAHQECMDYQHSQRNQGVKREPCPLCGCNINPEDGMCRGCGDYEATQGAMKDKELAWDQKDWARKHGAYRIL